MAPAEEGVFGWGVSSPTLQVAERVSASRLSSSRRYRPSARCRHVRRRPTNELDAEEGRRTSWCRTRRPSFCHPRSLKDRLTVLVSAWRSSAPDRPPVQRGPASRGYGSRWLRRDNNWTAASMGVGRVLCYRCPQVPRVKPSARGLHHLTSLLANSASPAHFSARGVGGHVDSTTAKNGTSPQTRIVDP